MMASQTVKKSNLPSRLKDLILLFAIPIGIAAIAAIVVYAPGLFADPKYDFIYSACDDFGCSHGFNVDSSGYVSTDANKPYSTNRTATLYYYNAENNSTKSLTLGEAKRYQLNTSSRSPDGYSLTRESSESGFLFWGNYQSDWYLKDGAKKKKVELSTLGSSYSGDVKFLGWINK